MAPVILFGKFNTGSFIPCASSTKFYTKLLDSFLPSWLQIASFLKFTYQPRYLRVTPQCTFLLFFPGCPLETLIRQVNPPPLDAAELLSPFPTPASGPYFDLHRTVNVTALKGVTTHLVCRVKRLGNYTVG